MTALALLPGPPRPLLYAAEAAAPAGPSSALRPMDLTLPEELGTIKEKFEGRDPRCLVIVQDAHAVPDAQRSIRKILEHAGRQWGIRFFALEGASTPLDPLLFKAFPDAVLLEKVFERYTQNGEISGAAAAALFYDGPALFKGVEDWPLYEEGLRLFLAAADAEKRTGAALSGFSETLEAEKKKVFSPALLTVDAAIRNYHRNQQDLAGFLKTLSEFKTPRPGSAVELLLSEASRTETDTSGFEAEIRHLAEEVRKRLLEREGSPEGKRDLARFNELFQAFQNSAEAPESFAAFLHETAGKLGLEASLSRVLHQRISAHKKMKDLEGTAVFDEIESYSREVRESLFRNDGERELFRRSRILDLMEKLAALELNRPEWREIKSLMAERSAWPLAGTGAELPRAEHFLESMKAYTDFYLNTEQRDLALFRNLEKEMRERADASALLVAGGFHAEALTDQLKEKGISYVLIAPSAFSLPEENLYRSRIRGEVSWSRYFREKNGSVNLYDAFVRGLRDDLLAERPDRRNEVLRIWRENLLRFLDGKGNGTETAGYTRYLDEAVSKPEKNFYAAWRNRVEEFSGRLRSLSQDGALTRDYLGTLFRSSGIPAATDFGFARSELRASLIQPKADRNQAVLRDHGGKIQLLVRYGIVPNIPPDGRVLEMGIGSGALMRGLMPFFHGDEDIRLLGLDINPEAVRQARETIAEAVRESGFKGKAEVRESDLFASVRRGEKFDVIFWNPPWSSEPSEGLLALAKNDPGFRTLRRFLREAPKYLSPGGRVYLILPPVSMEEVWTDAEREFTIGVPIFERTVNRMIGLYTLTPRSELRAEKVNALSYSMEADTLDQGFWTWFNENQPERRLDRELFEKIVSEGDEVLAQLIRDYPEKVYVKEVVRKPGEEGWALSEKDGRTVYLKLSSDYEGVTTLRLKGVRPRRDGEGRFLGYHTMGRGFVPVDSEPAGPGRIRFWKKEEGYKVFGGTSLSSARHEHEVLKAMASSPNLAPHADRPLGTGAYRESVFGLSGLGFVVIGMTSQDRRLAPGVQMDDDSEDEGARKLVFYLADYETHHRTELTPKAAESFASALGTLMRRYHDAGFYHDFPHFENFGLKPGADPQTLRSEDLIVRDLGTTTLRSTLAAADESGRTALAAMHRWMDLTKSIRYFQRHDNQSNDYFLKMAFLKGYTGSEEQARVLYEPLSRAGFDWTLNYYFNEKQYESESEKILDFDLPQYAAFKQFYDLMKRLERGETPPAPAPRSELRSTEKMILKWNDHYNRQPGKPDAEPGHLGVQFRDANLETAPGSLYEFDFLKEAARDFAGDLGWGLTDQEFASRKEIEKILRELQSAGRIDERLVEETLESFAVLEKAGGAYHRDVKLTGLTDRGEFFRAYYQAASGTFRTVPVLVEALARLSAPPRPESVHRLEDGLEVQREEGLHFRLEDGFNLGVREQIGLPAGTDALAYLREKPERTAALYQRSLEFELPLSHELRLALLRYQPEYQAWLDAQRKNPLKSEAFVRTSQSFLKIMGSSQNVIGILWDMYRSGILEALVPEMRNVRDIPSNFNVHIFTVGQHTMFNLKKFEDLRNTQDPQLQTGRQIAEDLTPAQLTQIRLTLLFHDLGKRMVKTPVEPDHAIVSSRDIVPLRLAEMGLSGDEIENVSWAVRDHMVLNAFARMQDVRFSAKLPVLLKTFGLDPEASLEKLKLLYLISLTDRDSVNPWFPFMGPEILDRLNFIYQTLEDYLGTSEADRSRHIEDMQKISHERTAAEWQSYKDLNREALRQRLAGLNAQSIRGYFKNVAVVDEGRFDAVRQGLIDRAHAMAADDGAFDYLLERLLAAFSMDQIRDYSEDEAVERMIFLIHLDFQKDSGQAAPVIYFNPQFSRTYERGYEIVAGAGTDQEGFFEKATAVLLRHRFDIEEADIRTLTNGEVVDTFQGFFRDEYPDERAHILMQDQLTRDMRDLFNGALGSPEKLFERDSRPYVAERTLGSVETEVHFLDDTEIYGTRASVFNLKTANRLGLLHALSIVLNSRRFNLVAAPVSTHPAMVNDTFYINRDGRVLSGEEKEGFVREVEKILSEPSIDLASLRSELRTEHLDLLWPPGVTDKDFARETFAAWKADWLAGDSLADGLRAWQIGDSLTFEFRGTDGTLLTRNNAPVQLAIRQNDAGKIIAVESKGYPGIDSKEMLRGVLKWMKERGIDYVQMDVTYPAFLDAVRDEWNRTRTAGPDPYVLPVRPAGNGTRMYFYLKLLNLDAVPVRSELRSGEESKLFQVFGPQEGARIQYQARWFAGAFGRLDAESQKKFLYPNLLLVLLGVKPLYLAVEEGAPSPREMMSSIDPDAVLAGSRLVFYADDKHLIALLPAAVKILSERAWLEQKGVLGAGDAGDLDAMDRALKSGDTQTLFSKTHELMMRVRGGIEAGGPGAMEKAHWFYGLLFGYPKADMESYARTLNAEGRPSLEDSRYRHSRYARISLFTEAPDSIWINRAEAALDYVYSLLQGQAGFETAAENYVQPFPAEVLTELKRLYTEDQGKAPELLLRPEWPALNQVFDGTARDVRGPELVFRRAQETLRRLDIRPGDTLADLGAGERGGLGLIAAMLGADVTAVESKPEAVRKIREHYERLKDFIAAKGGRFEVVEADLSTAGTAAKLGPKNFRHVIMTDTVTPSRAMAEGTPSAPPTYQTARIQGVFKTAAALKNAQPGRVLFSVPEYAAAGGRVTSAVPFLEEFALAMIQASGTGPASAVFVSVPYSDAIKRGVLYEFRPMSRSELRQAASEAVEALRPGRPEPDEETLDRIYGAASGAPDLFADLTEDIFLEREAALNEIEGTKTADPAYAAAAAAAALDLANRLLAGSAGAETASAPIRKVSLALNFSDGEVPPGFMDSLIKGVLENRISAEIFSEIRSHRELSRRFKEEMKDVITLRRLQPSELEKGTASTVEGLGIATALDRSSAQTTLNPMFQGLLFDFEGLSGDPDLEMSGQILFAAFLIKLAVLSAENADKPVADRAAYLRAELIRAIQEAGYLRKGDASLTAGEKGVIRVAGRDLIGALVDDMKARSEISRAA